MLFFREALAQLGAKREGGRTNQPSVPSKDTKWPVPARVNINDQIKRNGLFTVVLGQWPDDLGRA